jgi:predicted dehydrogenase
MPLHENSSRRKFLRDSAGLVALAQAPLKAAPSERVNLGFIGLGIRGSYLLKRFQAMPDTNAVAAADLYDGHLQNAKEVTDGKIQTGKEYRAVLDRKDVDAVVIATPDHWHMRMVLDAVSAGKDVYCEKPMTWSIEEGIQIQKVMKQSDRLLQIGSEGKTDQITAKAKEVVKSGVLGKINLARAAFFRNTAEGAWRYPIPPDASPETVDWPKFLGPAPRIPWSPERFFRWRCWWEYSGGVATDLFVHLLTTLHEILDLELPSSVVSNGGIYRWRDGRTVPDLMSSVYEYPSGMVMELCVNLGNARGDGVRGFTIMGSQGTMVVGNRAGNIEVYPEAPDLGVQRYGTNGWPKKLREQYFESAGADPDGKLKNPPPMPKEKQEIRVAHDPAWPSHFAHFIRSVKERAPSVEDAVAGHNAAAAAHLANLSYRQGRKITAREFSM